MDERNTDGVGRVSTVTPGVGLGWTDGGGITTVPEVGWERAVEVSLSLRWWGEGGRTVEVSLPFRWWDEGGRTVEVSLSTREGRSRSRSYTTDLRHGEFDGGWSEREGEAFYPRHFATTPGSVRVDTEKVGCDRAVPEEFGDPEVLLGGSLRRGTGWDPKSEVVVCSRSSVTPLPCTVGVLPPRWEPP